jgi:hypothetical protein
VKREEWPLAEETPAWWRDKPLTPKQLEAMREEYERAQIDDAKSAADYAANLKEYSRG